MAIGSFALMTLPGCGPEKIESAGTTPVAVKLADTASADLLICPAPPVAFPVDQSAVIPADARSAMMSLAFAYAATLDQLKRLINWNRPGSCALPADAEAR